MAPTDVMGRPRVYVTIKRDGYLVCRVLDLAFVDGVPVAVMSYVKRDGVLTVDKHFPLEAELLRKAAPLGAFQYDGVVTDRH